jgi:CheY-like chemotaxis protein
MLNDYNDSNNHNNHNDNNDEKISDYNTNKIKHHYYDKTNSFKLNSIINNERKVNIINNNSVLADDNKVYEYKNSIVENKILFQEQIFPILNILLVDDSLSVLKMTGKLLRRKGHIVEQAENGAEAVLKINARNQNTNISNNSNDDNKPFDVVLMDLQMPVMDGLEATRRIRSSEYKKTLLQNNESTSVNLNENKTIQPKKQLIIGCSANSDHDTMQEAFKAGVDAFIGKPFTIDTFHETVARFLNLDEYK